MSFPQPAETGKLRVLLRVLSLALAVADIICIVELWMIVGWVYIVITPVPAAWSLLNIIVISFNRPIHPGFHIAFDAAFTIVLWFFGILGVIALTAWTDYGVYDIGLVSAMFAVMVALGLVHFVHFVLACCDVHRRRRATMSASAAVKSVAV